MVENLNMLIYCPYTRFLWSDSKPVQEDISKMFLRRNTPYSTFTIRKIQVAKKLYGLHLEKKLLLSK